MLLISAMICFITALIATPLVKRLAIKIGAVDKPNERKVHQKLMPRLGGLAIFISMLVGLAISLPDSKFTIPVLLGSLVIIITGMLDDMYEISPKVKLLGQFIAASIVIYGGVEVEYIILPFYEGEFNLGMLSIPLTFLWIVGITNAINLIDGLDGLAAGVSSIVLLTISTMAIFIPNPFVMTLGFILLASTLGFLVYNFHPAKIFMGDTGALFLGFMISVLAVLGFKEITFFSLLLPIIILGVPISDTFFAIIRRIVNKKPLSAPDKSHLHHCLLRLGYSHRKTVLIIYAMSAFFGIAAIILSKAALWVAALIILILLVAIQLVVEVVGLVHENYRPMLKMIRKMTSKPSRRYSNQ